MVETDYDNYAAYVECTEDGSQNYAVISLTDINDVDPVLISYLQEKLKSLGANFENIGIIVHDEACLYSQ